MIDLTGKRILILGGTSASFDIVKEAQRLGVYVVVADNNDTGVSKEIANKAYKISTTDKENLRKLIVTEDIDGVFCGPSEFNILNSLKLSEYSSLPFYINEMQWNTCSNKQSFKDLCRKFDVPVIPEFHFSKEITNEEMAKVNFPVIVKPVDGSSSRGITICWNKEELLSAIEYALKNSESGHFLVEKYITNDHGFGCRYIANEGKIYLTATNDRYTVDDKDGKAKISSVAIFPSKYIDKYIDEINSKVIKMFESIGIKQGSFFMQALVDEDDQIYFHEMGLRLSGGLVYKMFEETCGFSDLEMMLRFQLGEKFSYNEELELINPYFNGKFTGSLNIPLNVGTINKIEGLNLIHNNPNVLDFVQYYVPGDTITQENIGTLAQLFARIKIIAESREHFSEIVNQIQNDLKITDIMNKDLIYRYFDIERMK